MDALPDPGLGRGRAMPNAGTGTGRCSHCLLVRARASRPDDGRRRAIRRNGPDRGASVPAAAQPDLGHQSGERPDSTRSGYRSRPRPRPGAGPVAARCATHRTRTMRCRAGAHLGRISGRPRSWERSADGFYGPFISSVLAQHGIFMAPTPTFRMFSTLTRTTMSRPLPMEVYELLAQLQEISQRQGWSRDHALRDGKFRLPKWPSRRQSAMTKRTSSSGNASL